jgi:hypothetical protein
MKVSDSFPQSSRSVSAGCSNAVFAQVMPITDGETLAGLSLIVNWTVVARLDELAMVGIETVE